MMTTTFMAMNLSAPLKNGKSISWMPLPSYYWNPWFFSKLRGKIDTCLRYMVRDLSQRGGEPRKTIVPMILAEIMSSLSACVDGRMFFEGCNLLLQLWAIDHFHKRSDVVETYLGQGNKIDNHPRRLACFAAPVGFVDW